MSRQSRTAVSTRPFACTIRPLNTDLIDNLVRTTARLHFEVAVQTNSHKELPNSLIKGTYKRGVAVFKFTIDWRMLFEPVRITMC